MKPGYPKYLNYLKIIRSIRAIRPIKAIKAVRAIRPIKAIKAIKAVRAIRAIRAIGAIRVLSLGLFLTQAFAVAATEAAGEAQDELYATLCAACHGHGTAPVGPYPPLFGSAILATAGPAYIAIKALQGAGNMFPLCGLATDEEVTRLANDLAQANGSLQPPITPAEVAVLRPAADECPDVEY